MPFRHDVASDKDATTNAVVAPDFERDRLRRPLSEMRLARTRSTAVLTVSAAMAGTAVDANDTINEDDDAQTWDEMAPLFLVGGRLLLWRMLIVCNDDDGDEDNAEEDVGWIEKLDTVDTTIMNNEMNKQQRCMIAGAGKRAERKKIYDCL